MVTDYQAQYDDDSSLFVQYVRPSFCHKNLEFHRALLMAILLLESPEMLSVNFTLLEKVVARDQ